MTKSLGKVCAVTLTMMVSFLALGCGKGWEMDYGKPAAQFLQQDVAEKGRAFIGQKVTVKGTVTALDVSKPGSAWVYLEHGIKCNFGSMKAMAEQYKVGDTLYVDGFLERCDPGDVLLEPAMGRDATAPFSPKQ